MRKKVLERILGGKKINAEWKRRANQELYEMCQELKISMLEVRKSGNRRQGDQEKYGLDKLKKILRNYD